MQADMKLIQAMLRDFAKVARILGDNKLPEIAETQASALDGMVIVPREELLDELYSAEFRLFRGIGGKPYIAEALQFVQSAIKLAQAHEQDDE